MAKVAQRLAQFSQQDATTPMPQTPKEAGNIIFETVMNTFEMVVSGGTALARGGLGGAVRALAASTNAVRNVQDLIAAVSPLTSAGASLPGAAGLGGRVRYQVANAAGTLVNAATATWTQTTATAGAEVAKFVLAVIQAGALVDALLVQPTTTDGETFLTLAGRLGGVPITRQVLIGADTTGPGGAGRALYCVT